MSVSRESDEDAALKGKYKSEGREMSNLEEKGDSAENALAELGG